MIKDTYEEPDEEIWRAMPHRNGEDYDSVMLTDYPTANTKYENEELRQKYILALTQSTFKDNGTPKEEQEARPKTLDECIAEQIAKEQK